MHRPPARKSYKRLIPLWEGRPLLIATGLFLTLCVALLYIFHPRFIQLTELRIYDTMLADRSSPPKTAVPVMVGIDDESLHAYGQWPWPRYRLATLVQRLRDLGADVVALDFLMPEPDRTSPEVIMAEREQNLNASPEHDRYVQRDSNTQRLAHALAGGNTILGYHFEFSGTDKGGAPESPVLPEGMVVFSATTNDEAWPRPTRMLRSMPSLTAVTGAEGFTNSQHDVDGVLRRVPLLLRYHGNYSPSLAFAAILLASPDRSLRIINNGSESTLVWGKRHIPVDRSGNLMIDFRKGKKSFPYLSAQDVLKGTPTAGSLKGKIVVVGSWARGLGDIHQVPVGQQLNGLEVHATIIDNILSGSHISRPDWARGAELFAILLLGVLSTWLLSQPGFVRALLTVVASTGGCYLGGREMLLTTGIYLSPLLPMVTPIIVMTILSIMKYGIEARKVLKRNRELIEAQDSIIISLSALAEARDEETGGHILRTRYYVETLARHLATLPHYSDLDEISIDLLAKSAQLHDIGKVGIPDHILLKPGPLTEEEFTIIKNHTLIGARAITKAINGIAHPEGLDFLHYARQMVESHHEKWNGSGYPHGLSGTEIPLSGRLMALSDVYDALVSKRIYKRTYTHAEAKEIIINESGQHFDPEVIAAFVAKNEEFINISRKFSDECFSDSKAFQPSKRATPHYGQ
jgi:CHASE2 domain-containing sensor protein